MLSGFTEQDFIPNADGTFEPKNRPLYNHHRFRLMIHVGLIGREELLALLASSVPSDQERLHSMTEEYRRLVREEGRAFLSRLYVAR